MSAATSSPTTTILRRTLLDPGIRSFRNYIQSELGVLRQSPVLVIHSTVGESECESSSSSSKHHKKPVADSCQWVKFTLGQQFGLRTVPATISSAVPTLESLDQTLELMQRTGASSVVSVGSGSAMDLAKAVAASISATTTSSTTQRVPLIMVPATYSALVAAGASHSLLLDGAEETLVPFPHNHQSLLLDLDSDLNLNADEDEDADADKNKDEDAVAQSSVVATLDHGKYMHGLQDENDRDVLLYAVSAVLLDAVYRNSAHPSLQGLLSETSELLALRNNVGSGGSDDENDADVHSLTSLLYRSSNLLSYGLDGDNLDDEANRSIPLALASSLIPTLFPETHPVSFFAGLVPGLSALCASSGNVNTTAQELLEQLGGPHTTQMPPPPLQVGDASLEGFSVPDMAVSHLRSNQAAWKALDAPDDVLVRVLQDSLER